MRNAESEFVSVFREVVVSFGDLRDRSGNQTANKIMEIRPWTTFRETLNDHVKNTTRHFILRPTRGARKASGLLASAYRSTKSNLVRRTDSNLNRIYLQSNASNSTTRPFEHENSTLHEFTKCLSNFPVILHGAYRSQTDNGQMPKAPRNPAIDHGSSMEESHQKHGSKNPKTGQRKACDVRTRRGRQARSSHSSASECLI